MGAFRQSCLAGNSDLAIAPADGACPFKLCQHLSCRHPRDTGAIGQGLLGEGKLAAVALSNIEQQASNPGLGGEASVAVDLVKGKAKRFRNRPGQRSDWKKAYVKLAQGQTIDFAGAEK